MMRTLLGAALMAFAMSATAQTPTHRVVALRFGSLVDGTGRTMRDAVVVV